MTCKIKNAFICVYPCLLCYSHSGKVAAVFVTFVWHCDKAFYLRGLARQRTSRNISLLPVLACTLAVVSVAREDIVHLYPCVVSGVGFRCCSRVSSYVWDVYIPLYPLARRERKEREVRTRVYLCHPVPCVPVYGGYGPAPACGRAHILHFTFWSSCVVKMLLKIKSKKIYRKRF